DLLADDLLLGLQPRAGAVDRQLGDLFAQLDVAVEPEGERVFGGTLDEARRLARAQALLGLAAELRIAHLQAEHEGDAVPDVFGRELHPAWQQAAELAEPAQGVGEAGPQAVDVGAVLRRRDQVDVAFLHQLAVRDPGRGPVHDLRLLAQAADEQFRRQRLASGELAGEVVAQAVGVVPFVALAAGFVGQAHGQAGAEHRLGTQQVAQRTQAELRRIEILRVGPEAQAGAGIALAYGAHDLEAAGRVAVAEGHAVFAAVALDVDLDQGRQRVDHAHAHAMQAAG